MSITLLEAANFMIVNGFILPDGKDKFKLTTKFSRDFKDACREQPHQFGRPVIQVNAEQQYKQFIIDARVPARLEAKIGDYQCNGYSEKGMKVFREALREGKSYDLLVKSTMLYYKSTIRFKVAIGRYMEEGIWKTHYDALARSAEEGTVEEHIKKEISNGESSAYELG